MTHLSKETNPSAHTWPAIIIIIIPIITIIVDDVNRSETALIYNDRAVLENFHICQAFTLMRNEDCNILAGLSKDEYR